VILKNLNNINGVTVKTTAIAPPYSTERSLNFPGVNEYVDMGSSSTLDFIQDTDVCTVEFWMKLTDYTADDLNVVMGNNGTSVKNAKGFTVYYENRSVAGSPKALIFQSSKQVASSPVATLQLNNAVSDNNWHHYMFTSNDSVGALYIDGVAQTLDTDTHGTNNSTGTATYAFTLGDTNPSLFPFYGKLAEVGIYNSTLDAADNTESYNGGSPIDLTGHTKSANLVAYWPIRSTDDATAGTGNIEDFAGTLDGTPVNHTVGDLSVDIPGSYETEYSLEFDGFNETVNFGDVLDIDYNQAYSILFWAKIDPTSDHIILSKRETSGNYRGWEVRFLSSQKLRFSQTSVLNTNDLLIDTDNTFAYSTWHCFGITKSTGNTSGAYTIYANGSSQTFTPILDNLTATTLNSVNMHMSGRGGTVVPFDGKLCEVVFVNKKISGAEFTEFYNSGIPIDASTSSFAGDIDSYYPINASDDATTTIFDNVGSNNGTPSFMEAGDIQNDIPI
jgi:hypothetical protein